MADVDVRTTLQKDIDLPKDPKESAEAHQPINKDDDFTTADEQDFHKASYSGLTHTQDNVWDPQFLEFSKWLRKTYFKDIGIQEMQKMNRENFFKMVTSVFFQISIYWVLYFTIPQYFYLWALPLFVFNCYLIQFGEIIHTRAHWPKKMTGSEQMDSLVDTVAIIITGTSKEGFRRRHIAAHYSDVGNLSRIFSDVWIPFSQFPSTFYIYPHKLLMLFMDVEYCRRENLSRQQLMVEMIGFYSYLSLMIYEVLFCDSCFLLVFHMGPGVIYHGAQVMGAMIAHSGIDKRNSFNSNGLFDWREAKGLFKVTLFVVDLFACGGCSNHGIHHAHTQLPLHMINNNLREINAYCLKTYKDVRFNTVLSHNIYGDLHAQLPAPQWYDYVIQACFIFVLLAYSAIIIMGAPLPPPIAFENMLLDYRWPFYVNKADVWARWKIYVDHLQIQSRKQLVVSPNAYLDIVANNFPRCEAYMKDHKVTIPPPADLKDRIMPQEVYDFNIGRPMEELRKKKQ
jgi:fatty acid desaturase